MVPGVRAEWVNIDLLDYGRMITQSKGNIIFTIFTLQTWYRRYQKILDLDQCPVTKYKSMPVYQINFTMSHIPYTVMD